MAAPKPDLMAIVRQNFGPEVISKLLDATITQAYQDAMQQHEEQVLYGADYGKRAGDHSAFIRTRYRDGVMHVDHLSTEEVYKPHATGNRADSIIIDDPINDRMGETIDMVLVPGSNPPRFEPR